MCLSGDHWSPVAPGNLSESHHTHSALFGRAFEQGLACLPRMSHYAEFHETYPILANPLTNLVVWQESFPPLQMEEAPQ